MDIVKCTNSLNTFKHNLKKYFLSELKNCKNCKNFKKIFLNLFLFSAIKNPYFHIWILILKVLLLKNHNGNTSFCKHVSYHPANNKSVFFIIFVNTQKATNTLDILINPFFHWQVNNCFTLILHTFQRNLERHMFLTTMMSI